MDLSGRIRAGRAERRRKQPFRPTLYTHVAALVRRYGLDETFLRELEARPDPSRRSPGGDPGPRAKATGLPTLFALSTEDEHRVIRGILEKAGNPYLEYATSPDEILLSRELFRRRPSLSPGTLACHHFGTLLLAGAETGPE